jgi:hypothetical protein
MFQVFYEMKSTPGVDKKIENLSTDSKLALAQFVKDWLNKLKNTEKKTMQAFGSSSRLKIMF